MTILNELFLRFYCLPIGDATFLVVLGAAVFLHLRRRWGAKGWWKTGVICLLLVWLAAVLFSTVLSRSGEGEGETVLIPLYSYWTVLTGGEKELLRSNFMNLLLFFPAGLLLASILPKKWPGWVVLLTVGILFAVLSGGIETAQHILRLGRAEVDDLLHNTGGALLGGWALAAEPYIAKIKTISHS